MITATRDQISYPEAEPINPSRCNRKHRPVSQRESPNERTYVRLFHPDRIDAPSRSGHAARSNAPIQNPRREALVHNMTAKSEYRTEVTGKEWG
jgi:hypothetical protein